MATGLLAATGRLFGVSPDVVSAAQKKTAGLSLEEFHDELFKGGAYGKRQKRVDKFPLEIVHQFFHVHEPEISTLPDYSQHVRLNKRKTRRWVGKRATVAGKEQTLTCRSYVITASMTWRKLYALFSI